MPYQQQWQPLSRVTAVSLRGCHGVVAVVWFLCGCHGVVAVVLREVGVLAADCNVITQSFFLPVGKYYSLFIFGIATTKEPDFS